MKRILIVLIVLVLTPALFAQGGGVKRRYRSDNFYVMLGAARGPSFSNFFNFVNDKYQPQFNNYSEHLKDFGGNIAIQVGYITRFQKNFGLDVGISVYGMKSKGQITNLSGEGEVGRIWHELDYQVGIFSATFPLIFEFMPKQKIIPYIGVGLSVFAMRLDDYRTVYSSSGAFADALRDTRTSVGGHFEAGVGYRISPRFWLDLRGRWHGGSGHLATLENNFGDFSINQSVEQYMLGVDYFIR